MDRERQPLVDQYAKETQQGMAGLLGQLPVGMQQVIEKPVKEVADAKFAEAFGGIRTKKVSDAFRGVQN